MSDLVPAHNPTPPSTTALPAILSVATANPRRRYSQRQTYDTISRFWEPYRHPRIEQVFMNSDIEYRNLCLDIETFTGNESIDAMHKRFVDGATGMGISAIRSALQDSDTRADDISFLIVGTCTGYVCPGLTSRYSKEIGFPNTLQRADLVGMGCAGALPAMQRAYDFVKSNPGKKALVVAVEVCSACYYLDESLETIIGNAICADGAAAMVIGMPDEGGGSGGRKGAFPHIAGFRTLLAPEYIDKVGFQNIEGRLRIVLSKDLRNTAGGLVGKVIDGILKDYALRREEITHWIIHPGGRKIIDAIQDELALTDDQIRNTRSVLKNFGNMSSATVMFVLKAAMEQVDGNRGVNGILGDSTLSRAMGRPEPGDYGIMLALGPGLAVEGALLQW